MQKEINHIVFYGTLMGKAGARDLRHSPKLTFLGDATTTGEMFNVGSFPALIPGTETIQCELYKINDDSVMKLFDSIEGYRNRGDQDLYRREVINIKVPSTEDMVDAWIYIWNSRVDGLKKINSGNWMER